MADEGYWNKFSQLWPARAAKGLWEGLMLPGDVYQGNISMYGDDGRTNPEVIRRSTDLAGAVMGGGMPMAERGALGMAGGNIAKSAGPEKIVSAATNFDNKIYEGQTHAHAYEKYKNETKKTDANAGAAYGGDGFLTNTGRFVDREEAQRIVDMASPNIDPANRRTMAQRQLYAEQLNPESATPLAAGLGF
jgi:hypothetical protein